LKILNNKKLYEAVRKGNGDDVKRYLQKGANANAYIAHYHDTALHCAAGGGASNTDEPLIAALLIESGADVNASTGGGETPLHMASSRGHKAIAALLIAKGAEVNFSSKYLGTPLHSASKYGRLEIIKLLVARGADVNARDELGRSPLHDAEDEGKFDVAKLLRKHGAKERAVKGPNYIDYKYLDDGHRKNRQTSLHITAAANLLDIARQLLIWGADIHAQNIWGATPLHLAVSNGNSEMAELLLLYGADVAIENNQGLTPIGLAAALGQQGLITLLKGSSLSGP